MPLQKAIITSGTMPLQVYQNHYLAKNSHVWASEVEEKETCFSSSSKTSSNKSLAVEPDEFDATAK